MDIGIIDVETCEPVENALVDLWHANATGYYAGHPLPARHLTNEVPALEGPRKGLLTAYPRSNFDGAYSVRAEPDPIPDVKCRRVAPGCVADEPPWRLPVHHHLPRLSVLPTLTYELC